MSSMNKKEQIKITADYHKRAVRPEGLTMLVLLFQKVMFFDVVASTTLGPAAALHHPDPPHLTVKRKQDEVCGVT